MQIVKQNNDIKIVTIISTILIIIGLLFIYSSSSVYALEHHGNSAYFLYKQLVGLALGLCALLVTRAVPLSWLERYAPGLFLASGILTSLTLVPRISSNIHGSSRWLSLAGVSFQPSELLKIGFILYMASFLTRKATHKPTFIKSYLPCLIVMGGVALLLLKQPDFGLTVTLIATAFIMLFVAAVPTRYLVATCLPLIPALIVLIIMRPYRIKRILIFLNPWNDPKGAGFQIIQSLIAIGSGGFFGLGIGQSRQKFFYLPMQHTDFIFSIIAEETGLLGSTLLLVLFGLFVFYGFRIAAQSQHAFGTLLCTGLVSLIGLQSAINIAVATGLVPTKGIGMPFVSYGNSALISSMIMLGLIMNIARDR